MASTSGLTDLLRLLDDLELETEQLKDAEPFLKQLFQGLKRLRDLEFPLDAVPRLYHVGERK